MYPQDPEPSYGTCPVLYSTIVIKTQYAAENCSSDTGTTYANPIEVASEGATYA